MQNIVLKNFFLYFNRLNKFTSSCELHPIKGFFPASILQQNILAAVWLVFSPLYVYQHIELLIEERVG